MEEGAPRPVPGERTINRVAARQSRRMKVGFATAVLARSISMDDKPVDGESEDGLVYLSASPFYAMMRRLAQARWRRSRRQAALERRMEPRMRAWKRRWPGESKAVATRLASFAVDRLVLAQPQAAPAKEQAAPQEVIKVVGPRKLTIRRRGDARALLSLLKGSRHGKAALEEMLQELLPELPEAERPEARRQIARIQRQVQAAPVVGGSSVPSEVASSGSAGVPSPSSGVPSSGSAVSKALGSGVVAGAPAPVTATAPVRSAASVGKVSPVGKAPVAEVPEMEEEAPRSSQLERAGRRLQRAVVAASPMARALEQALPPQLRRYTPQLAEALLAEEPARAARVLRRLSAAPHAVVEEALEQVEGALPAPVRASARLAPVGKRAGGLRTLSASSPMMAVVNPPVTEVPVETERASLMPRPVARPSKAVRKQVSTRNIAGRTTATAAGATISPSSPSPGVLRQTRTTAVQASEPVVRTGAPVRSGEPAVRSGEPVVRSADTAARSSVSVARSENPAMQAEDFVARSAIFRSVSGADLGAAVSREAVETAVVRSSRSRRSLENQAVEEDLPSTARLALRGQSSVNPSSRSVVARRDEKGRFVVATSEGESTEAPVMHAASRAQTGESVGRSVVPRRSRNAAPSAVLPTPAPEAVEAPAESSTKAAPATRAVPSTKAAPAAKTGPANRSERPVAGSRASSRDGTSGSVFAAARLNRVSASSMSASTLLAPVAAAASQPGARVAASRSVASAPRSAGTVATSAVPGTAPETARPVARPVETVRSVSGGATPAAKQAVEVEGDVRPSRTAEGRRPAVDVVSSALSSGATSAPVESEVPVVPVARPRHLARSLTRAMPFATRSAMPGMKTAVEAALSGSVPELTEILEAEPRLRTELAAAVARGEIPARSSVAQALAASRLSVSEPGRTRRLPTATPGVLAEGSEPRVEAEVSAVSPVAVSRSAGRPARVSPTRAVRASAEIPSDPALVRELFQMVERATQPTFLPLAASATSETASAPALRPGALAAAVQRHGSPALKLSLGGQTLAALETALQPLRARRSRTASPGPFFFAAATNEETASSPVSSGSPVANPAGRWVSARSLSNSTSVRVVRDAVGRLMAMPTETPASGRSVPRTRALRGASAPEVVFAAPAGAEPSAEAVTGRPVTWALRRSAMQDSPAIGGGRSSTPAALLAVGRRSGPEATVLGNRAEAPEGTEATSRAVGIAADRGETGGATTSRRARTADLGNTLHTVSSGGTAGPGWAARASDETTGLRTVDSLVKALARASSVEEVVRVITERVEGRQEVPTVLAPAFNEVAQQLRQEAREEVDRVMATQPTSRPTRVVAPAAEPLRPTASARNFRHGGRSAVASAVASNGAGASRVMKLVRKLQGLIHLAEEERRLSDARRRVRMAEDSASARAEGQAPLGQGGNPSQQREIDIEALGREVSEIVTREIEHRRSRRMEDSDEFWW